jgi:hypothetical protein
MNHTAVATNHEFPDKVYKYRKWNNTFHRSILTKNEVFFSSPQDFDDPYDCKNSVRYDLLAGNELEQFVIAKTEEYAPDAALHEKVQLRKLAISNLQNREFQLQKTEETYHEFCERLGVLCLTAYNKELSMWEKYADEHKGFCVGFHSKILFNDPLHFGGGGPVDYVEALPVIHPLDDYELRNIKLVYSKLNSWEFEKEYRVHKFNEYGFTPEQRKVVLPDSVFAEVILGANMPASDRLEIIIAIRTRFPDVTIFQASLRGSELTLDVIKP